MQNARMLIVRLAGAAALLPLPLLFAAPAATPGGRYSDVAVRTAAVAAFAARAAREKAAAEAAVRAQGLPARFEYKGALIEVMRLDEAGQPVYYKTENANAAISSAAKPVRNTAPYNVNGSNWIVGVWDGGSALSGHREFGGRVTVMDGAASHYHSTHVAGTIGAAGITASALGMAPHARMDSYDWNSNESEMAARGASAPGQTTKVYLSNHSYGTAGGWDDSYWYDGLSVTQEPAFGQYNSDAQDWDTIVFNAPYFLICKASGNDRNDIPPSTGSTFYYLSGASWVAAIYDPAIHAKGDGVYKGGYDNITTYGVAKNILTVGAVNDAVSGGVRALAAATMTSFSSWGPADDGRIKPDVVGNGVNLYSCDNGHTSDYTTLSGTSMATPNVCGSAQLLADYFLKQNPGQYVRASTLKALIIHTADDIGNAGPDYAYGWGLMNTRAAADLIFADAVASGAAKIIEAALTNAGGAHARTVITDGTDPLRVTLCWTDPAGTATTAHDSRTPCLVNDLDLRVTDPTGATNFPFALDYAAPSALATRADNMRDNVEQVLIPAPNTAGAYTVHISNKGIISSGPQVYSLIITGAIPEPGGLLAAALALLALRPKGKNNRAINQRDFYA